MQATIYVTTLSHVVYLCRFCNIHGIRKSSRLNSYELDEVVADIIDKVGGMHYHNTATKATIMRLFVSHHPPTGASNIYQLHAHSLF